MRNIRVGVAGAGAIAPSHCSGVQKHPSGELVAVADAHEERAKAMQKNFAIPKRYSDVNELIADGDIDAICIALPTYLHADVAVAALEAGKHVLLDKPFAMNQQEAVRVIETAKRMDKIFCVGMNQRFGKPAQTIRELIKRGELGELYHGEAAWCRRAGAPRFGTWFGDKSRSGGGALLDIGVHALDLCFYLLDNYHIETVSGVAYTKICNRGIGEGGWGKSDPGEFLFDVDDFSSAFIRLAGGVTVILKASWARHQPENDLASVQVFGTEAGATANPPRLCRFSASSPGDYEVIDVQNAELKYPACDRHVNWLDAILDNDELECKPEQSLVVQKTIDAIYESSKTGREVRI